MHFLAHPLVPFIIKSEDYHKVLILPKLICIFTQIENSFDELPK